MKKYFITTSLAVALLVPLFASADTSTSTATSTEMDTASTTIEVATTSEQLFILCSQEAIETRDVSLANAKITYNFAMEKAGLARKESEKKIVTISSASAKKTAVKNAVEDYKNAAKNAQKTLKEARQVAWTLFEDNSNTCEVTKNEADKKEQPNEVIDLLKIFE